MAFEDHIAILLSGAFDRPQKNKFKPADAPEYYALVAVPPSAGADISAILASVNPNWSNMIHPVETNAKQKKPYPGIPDDYLVFRMQSQFVPEIRDSNGAELVPTAENAGYIRSQLYAGANVRVRGTVKEWEFNGKRGLKFYLGGVMAAGGGERRASSSGSFDKFVPEDAPQSSGFGQPANAAPTGGFGQPATQAAPATQANEHPFVQQNGAAAFSAPVADPAKPFG